MVETTDCEWVGPLLAELATGAATGHERAQALRHVAGCRTCRRDLAELARVADDLLLLVPELEPPPGFETAVAQRILSLGDSRRGAVRRERREAPGTASWIRRLAGAVPRRLPTRTGVRVVAAVAALVVAASGGAAAAYWHATPQRQLADQYRQTIAAGGGRYPTALPVTAAGGTVVGNLFLLRGTPSWVVVALTAAPEPGNYTMSVLSNQGNRYTAGVCTVIDHAGTAGYPLPLAASDIAAIELTRPGVLLTVHPR